ncbi:hypothetical protein J4439_05845 [Candidatus Woesearchaeota archaeon]|nr:hypothetical protein [Candidatus Woesearchaeota archaeon]
MNEVVQTYYDGMLGMPTLRVLPSIRRPSFERGTILTALTSFQVGVFGFLIGYGISGFETGFVGWLLGSSLGLLAGALLAR